MGEMKDFLYGAKTCFPIINGGPIFGARDFNRVQVASRHVGVAEAKINPITTRSREEKNTIRKDFGNLQ